MNIAITALVRVLTSDALRSEMRSAGLIRAQDFGWDRVCAQYEAVYAPPSNIRVPKMAAL